jgi:hypothetical protein
MGRISFGEIERLFQMKSNAYVKSRDGNKVPGNVEKNAPKACGEVCSVAVTLSIYK